MKGYILDFSDVTHTGYITTDDGNRFKFNIIEWKEAELRPKKGLYVDFDVDGKKAIEIFIALKNQDSLAPSNSEIVEVFPQMNGKL